MESELRMHAVTQSLESSTKVETRSTETTPQKVGRIVKIKDTESELIGFRGILTKIHGLSLRPFGVRTIKKG